MKVKKVPLRKCVGCNEQSPKKELTRVVHNAAGEIFLDPSGKANGRGAYLHPKQDCLLAARKRKSLERAFSRAIPEEVYERMTEELHEG